MASEIDIGSVLNEFDITVEGDQVRKFGVRYRKKGGLPGEIYNCRKNVKAPKQEVTKPERSRAKGIYNLKFNGVIMLSNCDTEEVRTIKVAQITHFRPHNSKQWLKIIRRPN